MDITPADHYQTRFLFAQDEVHRYDVLINKYSIFRLVIMAAGITLFYQSLKPGNPWLPVLVFFIVVISFSFLVRQQNRFEKKRNYFRDLSAVYRNELASMLTRDNMYQNGTEWIDDRHPYTSDLDIFGPRSLFELVNRCATVSGNEKLADWLVKRASPTEILERQHAVAEISAAHEWRCHFQAVLLFANQANGNHAQKLFQYLQSASGADARWMRLYVRWVPLAFLMSAVFAWFYPIFILLIISLGIANLLIVQSYQTLVLKTDSLVGKMSRILARFSKAISAIREQSWESELSIRLASSVKNDQQGKLPDQIRRLSVLINQLTLGLSSIGPVLNIVMAWNVRQFFAIEDWKRANQVNLEEAFDVIASYEALISLSSLHLNYPNWVFPRIETGENYTLSATAIAHPLIAADIRVANDYNLSNDLKIDIITGSNMAGKSTFLRTLGINTVLALSGAPVCASAMEVSPMLVFSYMRIRDSLNESTSTFKAELDRLQSLLAILEKEDKVYFLIDEMLRGTNSVDKYLGSKAVIEKLISQRGVGIIATHDLQIAELEEKYPAYIRNFYFDIEIEGDDMKFDYKLKEGECKTFNASILLKRLGIYPDADKDDVV